MAQLANLQLVAQNPLEALNPFIRVGHSLERVFMHLGGADRSGGPYVIPHVSIESYMVYTNNVPCGHMRAPAKPQVVFAVESHMDMVAREMGLDPYEFRLKNILHNGDVNPVGGGWQDIRAEETLRAGAEASNWTGVKAKPNWGRGMAISDQPSGAGRSAASVSMDATGKVALQMSLWDTGTGAHTILRQVVAPDLLVYISEFQQRGAPVRASSKVSHDAGEIKAGALVKVLVVVAVGQRQARDAIQVEGIINHRGQFLVAPFEPQAVGLFHRADQRVV